MGTEAGTEEVLLRAQGPQDAGWGLEQEAGRPLPWGSVTLLSLLRWKKVGDTQLPLTACSLSPRAGGAGSRYPARPPILLSLPQNPKLRRPG